MRVFYVAYLEDGGVRRLVDAIRLLAKPTTRWSAHLTLRGPYDSLRDYPDLDAKLRGARIDVDGPGSFLVGTQNTVFLHCRSPLIAECWDKSDYDFNPHMTLYDGPSRSFAEHLLATLERRPVRFAFAASGLSAMISGQRSPDLCPSCIFADRSIVNILGDELHVSELEALDEQGRLRHISLLVDQLVDPALA